MNRRLSVRRATLGDLDVVVELRLALLREYGDHPLYGALRDDAEERARELYAAQLISPHEVIQLAERGGRVVGIMRLVDTASSPILKPDRYCYISSVYVRPAERRSGVLHALMAEAERWCEERGLAEMRLHNSASAPLAQDAWSALGFEIVEQVRRRSVAHRRSRGAPASRAHAEAH